MLAIGAFVLELAVPRRTLDFFDTVTAPPPPQHPSGIGIVAWRIAPWRGGFASAQLAD
jgi:hypothetical protein